MSLEAALAENTAAMKEMTAALREANEGRAAAAEAVREAVTGTKTRGRPAGAKDKDKVEPAGSAEPEKQPTPPTAAMTIEQFREKAGAFLAVAEDVKPKRKEFVKAVSAHYGVEKITQLPAEDYVKVSGWFDSFVKGDKVSFSDGEDDQAAAVEEEDDIG